MVGKKTEGDSKNLTEMEIDLGPAEEGPNTTGQDSRNKRWRPGGDKGGPSVTPQASQPNEKSWTTDVGKRLTTSEEINRVDSDIADTDLPPPPSRAERAKEEAARRNKKYGHYKV